MEAAKYGLGCFSYIGVGRLKIIDGIMDSYKYQEIILRNLPASAILMGLRSLIFSMTTILNILQDQQRTISKQKGSIYSNGPLNLSSESD
jgi:hypothetical protein